MPGSCRLSACSATRSPGRVVETWFNIDKPGDYYGECNQICGINHDAMSIDVHAVTPADFQVWLKSAKDKYSALRAPQHFAQLDEPDIAR